MTCQSQDDIVQRALIDLLAPTTLTSGHDTNTYKRKKKFRRTRREMISDWDCITAKPFIARIVVVEMRTSQTLSVYWSDPQSGHYIDQIWRKGVARTPSFCTLTGMRIRPGDSVFQPRTDEMYVPANRDYMLLAAAVRKD